MIGKKATIFIMMIFMLSIIGGTAMAAEKPYVTASLMKYEPMPGEPGKYVRVYIKLENTGSKTAENVKFEIAPEFPFSMDPGTKKTEDIGLLGAQSFQVLKYDIKVNKDATEGTNTLKARYTIDSEGLVWAEKELEVSIQTRDSVLSIEKIETEPEQIVPGDKGDISLELRNLADSFISDLTVRLDFSDDDLPFAPYNSPSEKTVYQLNSQEMKEFQFQIIAYPDADAGVYKMPVDISYKDNVGNEYSRQEIVGIIVNSRPDIKIVVDSTSFVSGTKSGEVVLKIINKGLTDVKFMNLKIIETEEYEVITASNEEYIGNLDSDDFETVDYKLYLKGEEQNVEIPLELEYRDNNNKLYQEDLSLNLEIHSAGKNGGSGGSAGWIIALIVIIGVAILLYRRHRKKQKKKSRD